MAVTRFWVGGTGTWDATTTHWSASSGGAGGASVPNTSADTAVFDAASGGGTVTRTATGALGNLDFRGQGITGDFSGTFAGSGQFGGLNGNLTWSPTMTASYTGTIFHNASGTITSNGLVVNAQHTVNGAGITVQQADDYHTNKGLSLTFTGSWKTNGHQLRCDNGFNFSSASARTFDFTGSLVIAGGNTGGGIFASATNLTLTYNASSKVQFLMTGNAASFQSVGLVWPDIDVAGSGGGTLTFGTAGVGNPSYGNITLNNTGGATLTWNVTQSAKSIVASAGCTMTLAGNQNATLTAGDYKLVNTMPAPTYSGSMTFNAAATQNVTTGGLTLAHNITINGAGTTVKFLDSFTSTNTISLTVGGLKTNGQAMNTKDLIMANGTTLDTTGGTTWTLASTVHITWQVPASGSCTFTTDANFVVQCNMGAQNIGFHGGSGNTYATINVSRVSGAGIIAFSDNFTMTNLNLQTAPVSLEWTPGFVFTIGTLTGSGTPANHNNFHSNAPTNQYTLSKAQNFVSTVDYLDVTDAKMTGGGFWDVGAHGIDGGNNNGVRFLPGVIGRAAA